MSMQRSPRPAAADGSGRGGEEDLGIDDAMIRSVVHAFYDAARRDPWLGPVFESRVEDWPAHLARMCSFWASVTLGSGEYHGRPMPMHMPLPVDGRHFDRWLALFAETVHAHCSAPAAARFLAAAGRIAQSLELGIAGHQGMLLRRGERLRRPDHELLMPTPDDGVAS